MGRDEESHRGDAVQAERRSGHRGEGRSPERQSRHRRIQAAEIGCWIARRLPVGRPLAEAADQVEEFS